MLALLYVCGEVQAQHLVMVLFLNRVYVNFGWKLYGMQSLQFTGQDGVGNWILLLPHGSGAQLFISHASLNSLVSQMIVIAELAVK